MLDALVLDPELQNRLNFKQLAREVGLYRDVSFASSLREGLDRLNGTKEYDLLYVSSRFDFEVVRQFLPAAKRTPRGRDSAYLLLLRATQNETDLIARAVACGADGVLVEPYSVDDIATCTKLAMKVRKQRLDARYRSAVALLVESAISHVDAAWAEVKGGLQAVPSFRKLAAIRDDLLTLPAEYQSLFHDQLADQTAMLAPAPPPAKGIGPYMGVSKRLKARLVKKGL